MEIDKTTWYLRQICPHCRQGYPAFSYCLKCGFVTLMCEETGEFFKNPKNLGEGLIDNCSHCGHADFDSADSDQIIKGGFSTTDYQ